jgi:hypothetical protein
MKLVCLYIPKHIINEINTLKYYFKHIHIFTNQINILNIYVFIYTFTNQINIVKHYFKYVSWNMYINKSNKHSKHVFICTISLIFKYTYFSYEKYTYFRPKKFVPKFMTLNEFLNEIYISTLFSVMHFLVLAFTPQQNMYLQIKK